MMQQNAHRSPCMESLEGRLLLDGQPTDISLHVPAKMYEGKTVVITVHQPADFEQQVQSWKINWGDGIKTNQEWGNTVLKHVYSQFGTYMADLTATLQNGNKVNLGFTAEVTNVKPAPKIESFVAAVPNQPVTINFNPGDSARLDSLLVSWALVGSKKSVSDVPASDPKAQSLTYTFTTPGKYTLNMSTHDSGGLVGQTTRTIRIAPVVGQRDSVNPAITNLVVGGTKGDDLITFQNRWSGVEIFLNGHSYGVFSAPGKLIAYGGPGNDVIAADAILDNPVVFYGGSGNDTLAGGSSTNELFGGSGTNKIIQPGL